MKLDAPGDDRIIILEFEILGGIKIISALFESRMSEEYYSILFVELTVLFFCLRVQFLILGEMVSFHAESGFETGSSIPFLTTISITASAPVVYLPNLSTTIFIANYSLSEFRV